MEVGLVISGAAVFLIGSVVGAGVVIYCVKQYLKMNGYFINEMWQLIKPMSEDEQRILFSYLEKYERRPIKRQ